jgi:uncharacterized membrane protein
MVVYASGVVEFMLGVLLLILKCTQITVTGSMVLMLVFLPIPISNVFSDTPPVGSYEAALIRLLIQFVFIVWAYLTRHFV